MKKSGAIAIIIAFFSVAYYFAIFLPGTHLKIAKPSEVAIKTDTISKEGFGMQEKCGKISKAFFDEQGYVEGASSNYKFHYSLKENKFFILIRNFSQAHSKGRGTLRTEDLYDILTNRSYGTFIHQTFVGARPPSVGWQLFDKNGRLESEWVEVIKPYMED